MKPQGFTLVELIIITAIVGLLAGVTLVSIRGGDDTTAMDSAVRQLASDIKLAQSKSLAGEQHNGAFPQGGYGIEIFRSVYADSSEGDYALFADVDGDGRCPFQCKDDSVERIGEMRQLPTGVSVVRHYSHADVDPGTTLPSGWDSVSDWRGSFTFGIDGGVAFTYTDESLPVESAGSFGVRFQRDGEDRYGYLYLSGATAVIFSDDNS